MKETAYVDVYAKTSDKIYTIKLNIMRRKIFKLLIGFLLIFEITNGQVQEAWSTESVGDFFNDGGPSLVLDNNENSIVGINTHFLSFEGSDNGVDVSSFNISKIKSDGTLVFNIREDASPSSNKRLAGMVVDNSGNIYAAVSEFWWADQKEAILGGRFLVYKYSPAGTLLWKKNYTDGQYSSPQAIDIDPSGNVYLTGLCKESGALLTDKLADYLTVKWNSSGTLLWAKRYDGASPGEGANAARDMVVDESGNVYITGSSQRDGLINYATIKYNTDGTELWVQRYTGTGSDDDGAFAITLDNNGFVYVTGMSEGTVATIKYNNDGVQQWVKRKGTDITDVQEIKVDPSGNVFVLGYDRQLKALLIKYFSDGNEAWTIQNFRTLYSMTLDGTGNVYVSGTESSYGVLEKYNSAGASQWVKTFPSNIEPGINNPVAVFPGNDNVYSLNFYWINCSGCGTPRYTPKLFKYTQCSIVCPKDITINTDPGECTAVINYDVKVTGECGNVAYSQPSGTKLPVGTTIVAVVSLSSGEQCSFNVTVVDKEKPVFTNCPASKSVNANPGVCYASAASVNAGLATATDNCSAAVVGTRSDGLSLTDNYPRGITTITWKATDKSGNSATCTQIITVIDNEKPTISIGNKNVNTDLGNCYAVLSLNDLGTPVTSDNCLDGLIVTTPTLPFNNQFPKGTTQLIWKVTDASGNTATTVQTVTVTDNEPPKIENLSATPDVLTPPDRKMKAVTVNYTTSDNCGVQSAVISNITSNELVDGPGAGNTSPDWEYIDANHVRLRAERIATGSGRTYTITITCTDVSGNVSTSKVNVLVRNSIISPKSGQAFIVNSTVNMKGEFWDKPGATHTAKWSIDDLTTAKASLSEPAGDKNGSVTGSYKFTSPGVYKLQMNITDQKGVTQYTNNNGCLDALVVIYDPNGGYSYGGGWYYSNKGALVADPEAKGDVSYGYTVNYYKGATRPKGETQFKFGDFEFNAVNFDYLVVNGAYASFAGTGKITGGQSGVNFIMTVIDGQLDGSGMDKVRMKIYNKTTGQVYYDNQPGAGDNALPVAKVGDGSTIVISSAASTTVQARRNDQGISNSKLFEVKVYPNPSAADFMVSINSNNHQPAFIKITNSIGQVVQYFQTGNKNITIGKELKPGIYVVEIKQGENNQAIKLIKY